MIEDVAAQAVRAHRNKSAVIVVVVVVVIVVVLVLIVVVAVVVAFCVVLLQAAAYASSDGILTERMIEEIVAEAVRAHKKKSDWRLEQETKQGTSSSSVPRSAKDMAAFTPPAVAESSAVS